MVGTLSPQLRVGIPRSILHYEFNGAIEGFLREIGANAVLSPPTNRDIFLAGKRLVLDEICFPIKVYVGHVAHLIAQGVDRIVIPVVVGHENDRVFPCHLQTRLADLVRSLAICDEARILSPSFRFDGCGLTAEGFHELSDLLGVLPGACDRALETLVRREAQTPPVSKANPEQATIGLAGRPYVIQDAWANHAIVERIRRTGCRVWMESDVSSLGYAPEGSGLHFGLAARTLALTSAFDRCSQVDGIVFLLPFNCGPDGDIARHLTRTTTTPMMTLVLDELHSDAGLVTRVEAFADLLSRRHASRIRGVS